MCDDIGHTLPKCWSLETLVLLTFIRVHGAHILVWIHCTTCTVKMSTIVKHWSCSHIDHKYHVLRCISSYGANIPPFISTKRTTAMLGKKSWCIVVLVGILCSTVCHFCDSLLSWKTLEVVFEIAVHVFFKTQELQWRIWLHCHHSLLCDFCLAEIKFNDNCSYSVVWRNIIEWYFATMK